MANRHPPSSLTFGWRQPGRLDALLHALFNGACLFCGCTTQQREICAGCLEDLPWISAACQRCGLPLASGAKTCAACLNHPPALDRTLALWCYTDGVDRLIRDFKLKGDLAAGRLLSELAAESLRRRAHRCAGPLIPMPLHPQRYRERGFNQSALIARWLGPRVITTLVKRHHNSPSQRQLSAEQRSDNVESAFLLCHPPPRVVTLVDDVLTTGASLNALAACLRAGGTERIEAITLARAI